MAITQIIGTQGAGKSVHAVCMGIKEMKKGNPVYSNLFIKGAYKVCLEDLMEYDLEENCTVILDEGASMGLGSRGESYKKNNKENIIEVFTMHRHYKIKNIIVISPGFSDVIPIIRDNTTDLLLVNKSIFNILGFNCVRSIGRSVVLQNSGGTSAPSMTYFFKHYFPRYHYRKHAFEYYDTYSSKTLKKKKFEIWGGKSILEIKEEEKWFNVEEEERKYNNIVNIFKNVKMFEKNVKENDKKLAECIYKMYNKFIGRMNLFNVKKEKEVSEYVEEEERKSNNIES